MTTDSALPLEDFIQAVQFQLDRAQEAMAVKARNMNLPLTFAVKDITLDLRAHVEFSKSVIRIRPAAPTDVEASVFHLVFTAITRPMIEENAIQFSAEHDDRNIEDLGDDVTPDERRRLEWMGVRTIGKLEQLRDSSQDKAVLGRVTNLSRDRLERILDSRPRPLLHDVLPVPQRQDQQPDLPALVRVRGRHLAGDGVPQVMISGEPVSVVKANDGELLLAPKPHQLAGELVVHAGQHPSKSMAFDLRPFFTQKPPTAASTNGAGDGASP
jgi:hypothetical protein